MVHFHQYPSNTIEVGSLGEQKSGSCVNVHHFVIVCSVQSLNGARHQNAGRIHQHIKSSKFFYGLFHYLSGDFLLREICCNGHHQTGGGGSLASRGDLLQGSGVATNQAEPAAKSCKVDCHPSSDP